MAGTPSLLPKAILEVIKRMTSEEQQELSKLLLLRESKSLKEERTSQNGRRYGDPKFYLGTTPKGLNLQIPEESIHSVLELLVQNLSSAKIDVFISGPQQVEEMELTPEAFGQLLSKSKKQFSDLYALIESDDNEIASTGGGCISVLLNPSMMKKRAELATKIAQSCGYLHRFTGKHFYAIDWEDELEIREDEKNS